MKIKVPVKFEGEVEVEVPNDAVNPEALAANFALCMILATTENPDSPAEDACEDYLDTLPEHVEHAVGEYWWDKTVIADSGLGGTWTTPNYQPAPRT